MNQNQKNRKKLSIENVVFMFGCVFVAVFLIIMMVQLYRIIIANETYCHIENNITTDLPRYECVNFKLDTKEIEKININKLLQLNVSFVKCYDNYDEMPLCNNPELYYNSYPLDFFCNKTCDIKGDLCIGYSVLFYDIGLNDSDMEIMKKQYEQLFSRKKYENIDEWDNAIKNCERT